MTPQTQPQFDPFLSAFIQATELTLQDLCKIPIRGHRRLKPGELLGKDISVAGLIGITSHTIQGSMSIQFPRSTFLDVMNGMLGEEMTELAPGMEDGAAELTNIIFGNAKVSLNENGFGIQMAIPTLLTGTSIQSVASGEAEGVEFKTDGESFYVVFDLKKKTTDVAPPPASTPKKAEWSADMLLEFVRAVRKTLEVQFNTQIEIGNPFKKTAEKNFLFDVGSVIGVNESGFSGYFGLFYESSSFLALMNNMLGTELKELDAEVQDGASEITNICFGVAKQVLNSNGHAITMALPNLILGRDIRSSMAETKGRNTIVVPLKIPSGRFWIEFSYGESAGT
jgi:CheY-specific phosphatase CheX